MTLALTFVTPLLLIGAIAAGIPFLLHLLSSVRAQEAYFPTLRFLRTSMEKTARRRRIQHWLLLVLRALLLAVLAVAVAEPISQAAGGWIGRRRYAAVVVLDNSLSMGVRTAETTRLARAKAQVATLLGGEDKPALAALLTTNGGWVSRELTAQLEPLRDGAATASIGFGRAPLAQRLSAAVELLKDESVPRKAIYLFSDLQRVSFDELTSLDALAKAEDIHLLVVNTARKEVDNVGISDLAIAGQKIADQVLEFTATLVNSSATDRRVNVGLRVGGRSVGRRIGVNLRAVGEDGSVATVTFHRRFRQPGAVEGEVILEEADDLAADNVRRFALRIGGRVNVLVVRGGEVASDTPALDPAAMLMFALDPYADETKPWSITPRIVEAGQFDERALEKVAAAFFCEVPAFTATQVRAIESFVRGGRTAVFFLGGDVDVENYNRLFVEQAATGGGLLPARIEHAEGEVGPAADATPVDRVDARDAYFEGLFENQDDYLTVLVQRYFRFAPSPDGAKVLMRLEGGDPLILSKRFGRGRVVVSAVPASMQWSNLPATGLFVPMVDRMSRLSPRYGGQDNTYLAGTKVTIRPQGVAPGGEQADANVNVTLPADARGVSRTLSVPLLKTAEGYSADFTDTAAPGVYRWAVAGRTDGGEQSEGAFVVNAVGEESKLEPVAPESLQEAMRKQGAQRVYVGDSLGEVHAAAMEHARGRNWWDVLLVAVIVLLVVEAAVANHRRKAAEIIPAHLNPRLAGAGAS